MCKKKGQINDIKKMPEEKKIQEYIWKSRKHWCELIPKVKFPKGKEFNNEDSIISLRADDIIVKIVTKRLKELDETVRSIDLFGKEVLLTKEGDSTLRADFLGMPTNSTGIAILELKRDNQSARQAFTELLAYSNHMNSIFKTQNQDDLVLVLISPMDVRTVREAFLQSLIFDNKRVYALEPTFSDITDLRTLKLSPWIPNTFELRTITEAAFAKRNFDIYKIVWRDSPDDWNPSKEKDVPSEFQEARMNKVSAFAAQLMESKGIHGFVFSSHAWPELDFPLPNSLVLVGLNPYKVANDEFYVRSNLGIRMTEIPEISDYGTNLADIIPGLNGSAKKIHLDENYLSWLSLGWSTHLLQIGQEVVNTLVKNTEGEWLDTDRGSMNWHQYESNFLENIACFNYDIRPTGLIRELFWEFLKIDYDFIAKNNIQDHPIYGAIEKWAVETSTSHSIFNEFIDRLFGDPFGIRDI